MAESDLVKRCREALGELGIGQPGDGVELRGGHDQRPREGLGLLLVVDRLPRPPGVDRVAVEAQRRHEAPLGMVGSSTSMCGAQWTRSPASAARRPRCTMAGMPHVGRGTSGSPRAHAFGRPTRQGPSASPVLIGHRPSGHRPSALDVSCEPAAILCRCQPETWPAVRQRTRRAAESAKKKPLTGLQFAWARKRVATGSRETEASRPAAQLGAAAGRLADAWGLDSRRPSRPVRCRA